MSFTVLVSVAAVLLAFATVVASKLSAAVEALSKAVLASRSHCFLAITKKLRSKWCENYKTMHSDIIGSTSKTSKLYLFALNHAGPELIDPLEKDIVDLLNILLQR